MSSLSLNAFPAWPFGPLPVLMSDLGGFRSSEPALMSLSLTCGCILSVPLELHGKFGFQIKIRSIVSDRSPFFTLITALQVQL